MSRKRDGVRAAVLSVSNWRNGISADSRMVNRTVTLVVDLADEDAAGVV